MNLEKPPRRWFAFSLRTLFVVLTIFACWLGWQIHVVRERVAEIDWIEQHEGYVSTYDAPVGIDRFMISDDFSVMRRKFPEVRRLFGDEPVFRVHFGETAPVAKSDLDRISRLFPEAMVGVAPASTAPPNDPPTPAD